LAWYAVWHKREGRGFLLLLLYNVQKIYISCNTAITAIYYLDDHIHERDPYKLIIS